MTNKNKYVVPVCVLFLIGLFITFIIAVSGCNSCKTNSQTCGRKGSVSGSSNGYRYDPEIYEKSGGMAGYSTSYRDTSPEGGGYINYPYVQTVPWWFNTPRYWGIYLRRYPYYMNALRSHLISYRDNGYFPQSLLVPVVSHDWRGGGRRGRGRFGRRGRGRGRKEDEEGEDGGD